MRGIQHSTETIQWLRDNYPKKGALFCADKLNVSTQGAKWLAWKYGVSYLGTPKYGYTFNRDYENKHLIYLLGYFWADGCLYIKPRSKQFQFGIQEQDGKEIEPLLSSLGEDNLFSKRYCQSKGRNPEFIINTRNMEFCQMLDDFDFNQKSYCEPSILLKTIDKKMHYLFWRGFFDGDGSVCVSKKRQVIVSFTGPHDYKWNFLYYMLDSLKIRYRLDKRETKLGKNSRVCFWRRHDAEKFFSYIYPNGYDFGLKRKYDKFILPPLPDGFFERPNRRKID
jgi:hypothetical protein